MSRIKLPSIRREFKLSVVVVIFAVVLEKITVLQSLLAMFNQDKLLPTAFLSLADRISNSPIYIGSIVVLAGFPIAVWFATRRIESRLKTQLDHLDGALSNLIDAMRATEHLDKQKRSDLLLPLLQKISSALPGNPGMYRSLVIEPMDDGSIVSIANLGVPVKRVDQLEQNTNWKTNQSYFRRALDRHVESRPASGRDAVVLISGKNHGYLEDCPDPTYKAGLAHLLITLDRDHVIRRPNEPLDPLSIAIVSISCTELDVLRPNEEPALIERIEPSLNAVDSVLFMFRAIERIKIASKSAA